jgi:hypothetical protein
MCLFVEEETHDPVLSKGSYMGFDWVVTHNGGGYRCGYIKVRRGHPWYGKDYNAIDAIVHEGLTFSDYKVKFDGERSDDGYWVGFHCGHVFDKIDLSLPISDFFMGSALGDCLLWDDDFSTLRTTEYVESECRSLCEQASRAINLSA